jgi:hypothetical protein
VTPHFYHNLVGLPLLGQTTQLLALQGFTSQATTIELDKETIFTQSPTDLNTTSLNTFLSFHDKTVEELKEISVTQGETHYIRKMAVIPPPLAVLLIVSKTTCPWTILYQAITIIHNHNHNDTGRPTIEYTANYYPLLLTLWSFT